MENIGKILLENNNTKIPFLDDLYNGTYDTTFLLNFNPFFYKWNPYKLKYERTADYKGRVGYGIYVLPESEYSDHHYFLFYQKSHFIHNYKSDFYIYDIGNDPDVLNEIIEFLKNHNEFIRGKREDYLNMALDHNAFNAYDIAAFKYPHYNTDLNNTKVPEYVVGWYLNKDISLKEKERESYYKKESILKKSKK